jgi:glycosyltransferase involved in cell wall biosynthesis
MKILYFYQYFTTPKGAWSTRAYEFARRWVEAGDEVTIVTSVYYKSDIQPDSFVTRRLIDGIDVRIINIPISNKQSVLQQSWTFIQYAAVSCWYAITLPADLVLASSGPITIALPGLVARYLRRRRFVFEVRDIWPEGAVQLGLLKNRAVIRVLRWFEHFCYRSSQVTVALSEGMKSWIEDNYGFRRLEVVPNASDNDLAESETRSDFALPNWALGRKVVVYAGALGLMYECDQLIEIATHWQELGISGIELVVIGTGADHQRLAQIAQEENLTALHFLGQQPRHEVFRWLSSSLCVLSLFRRLPFFDTCSPNKLFDAFAAGRPIIQDTQGWMKQLIEREQCGITVPRGDTRAMAEAIVRLAEDPEYCERLAANSRRVGREQFGRGLLAARMRQILHKAATE